jgi:soluble cytochrome b562
MSKLRSISTKIWTDTWFENLNSNEKIVFIYLLTNDLTNMLGCYEISLRKISFDTNIKLDIVKKIISKFEDNNKVVYSENYLLIRNFIKNQNYNPNMKKSAITTYNELPKKLKDKTLQVIKIEDVNKGFQRLYKGLGMVSKIEYEYEVEDEKEIEDEIKYFRNFAHLKITIEENNKLLKDYNQNQINNIYDAIENYKKNTSYKSLYLTAKRWLRKEYPKRQKDIEKNYVEYVLFEETEKRYMDRKEFDNLFNNGKIAATTYKYITK